MSSNSWFNHPDMVGGWKTQHQNQNGNYYQLDHSDHNNPIVHPLPLQIGGPYQQTWVMGLTPVGYDISAIGYDGMLIFDQSTWKNIAHPVPIGTGEFILDESVLGGEDVLG